ncbi:MAG: HipA protein [Verrucomicrobia bacterium]|nr:HipA protein [Verrucomicrobiota bacterium]
MNRILQVYAGMDPRLVGVLRFEAQGNRERASFEYDASWLAEGFSLEPGLPLVRGPQFHRPIAGGSIFHGSIADTEPDGWGQRVIRRDQAKRRESAKKKGIAATPVLHAIDYLLAVDDASRLGALRFKDEQGLFQRVTEDGERTTPPLLELKRLLSATRAVEKNRETAADLAYLRGRGTSLGGMRPKCSVIDDDGHLAIGKFPSVDDERAVTKAEVLALILAKKAKINAAAARIVMSDQSPVALIRRFDRTPEQKRLLYISAATLLGIPKGDPGDHAYTEIVDAIRQRGQSVKADIEELWRRMAFTVLIRNVDDHLHNHGFLHANKGLWRLAPAFDLNPFPEPGRELKTWISDATGPAGTVEALFSVIAYFGISKAQARKILGEVETAVSLWREVGAKLGMTKREMNSFAEAFEHREREAAQRV